MERPSRNAPDPLTSPSRLTPEPRLVTFGQRVVLPRGADPVAARDLGATSALCDPADASAVEAAGLVSVTSADAPAGLHRVRAFPSHPARPGESVVVHADDTATGLLSAAARVTVVGADLQKVCSTI